MKLLGAQTEDKHLQHHQLYKVTLIKKKRVRVQQLISVRQTNSQTDRQKEAGRQTDSRWRRGSWQTGVYR